MEKKESYKLPIILGEDTEGNIIIKDLAELGSLLICGDSGSGKTNFINSVINTTLRFKGSGKVKFILLDLKGIKFYTYDGVGSLAFPIVNNLEDSALTVFDCLDEINRRKTEDTTIPYWIVIIDEYSDLMRSRCLEIENALIRLIKEGKDVAIYTILTTSIITEDVVSEKLKDVMQNKIAFSIPRLESSKNFLGTSGTEDLRGKGDMLFKEAGVDNLRRIQTPCAEDQRICDSPDWENDGYRNHTKKSLKDKLERLYGKELIVRAKEIATLNQKVNATLLHRKLQIGYNLSANLIDCLEEEGFIGPQEGSESRKVLIKPKS